MSKSRILVAPLNWGLGHASRCIPIIKQLIALDNDVIIGGDGESFDLLIKEFPELERVKIQGYDISYPTNGNMAFHFLKQYRKMRRHVTYEHSILVKLISEKRIDAVISDNRYELSSSKVPTVFITHQLNIQTKGWQKIGKPLIDKTINGYINKFDEVWIPDLSGDFQLSGKLSRSNKFSGKSFNIGLLSRFSKPENKNISKSIDLLIILSGPEPQRSILEKLLISQAIKTELKTVMLLGKPDEQIRKEINNVELISHLPDDEFSELIQCADSVITRPGYSTLMDLAIMNKKAVFIPTPGQTEQEYLADRLLNEGIAFSQGQSSFNLADAIANQSKYKGLFLDNKPELLESRIKNLLNIC